jgi:hypothetical protein
MVQGTGENILRDYRTDGSRMGQIVAQLTDC